MADQDEKLTESKKDEESSIDGGNQEGSSKSSGKAPAGYVTEESYKGLQKVLGKRDAEIVILNEKLDKATSDLEELKSSSGTLSKKHSDAETSLQETKRLLDETQADKTKLEKKVTQQDIILKEFPELAKLTKFIPQAEDEDQYRTNAKEFLNALTSETEEGILKKLKGASPAAAQKKGIVQTPEEEDRLWSDVYKFAGVDKEKFEEANKKLQEYLAAKS